VQVDPTQAQVVEPEKNLGNAWYTLDALPDPLHSAVAGYLRDHGDRIKVLINKHINNER
jgi:hypothetical protein